MTKHDAEQIRRDKEARALTPEQLFAQLKREVERKRPDLMKRIKPKGK